MSWLWTTRGHDCRPWTGGRSGLPEGITGISIDSRSLQPGEAFFAIKGDRVDGHDYASMPMANGAALLVVSRRQAAGAGAADGADDRRRGRAGGARQAWACARARSRAQIIAVTGSVGKTTTKEDAAPRAAPSGKVHASVAVLQQSLGRAADAGAHAARHDFGVFESA
jgi:UDP-N-acetylmuramoyl-tripeptide--D-alanyl-D-alanine ligase